MFSQKTLPKHCNELQRELLNLFHSSGLPMHFNKTGNKEFTNYQRISLIILFKRNKKSIRDFTKELKESRWVSWLGLKKIPGKSTLHDWLKLFGTRLIRQLIKLVTDVSQLRIAAIDGTGIQSKFRSQYYEKRMKDFKLKNNRPYHKLDLLVDTNGKKQILEYSFLLKNRSDTYVGKMIVGRIKFKRIKIVGDKGYPDYEYEELAKSNQNNFISPPKDYKGKGKHSNYRRQRKERNYQSNKQVYNRRAIVEAVISSIKRVQDTKLRSRLPYMEKREMAWHILLYNLRMNIKFNENKLNCRAWDIDYFFIQIKIYVFPDKAERPKGLNSHI